MALTEREKKKKLKEKIWDNFKEAKVWKNGKLVKDGDFVDKHWLAEKFKRAWNNRGKYPRYPRLK